MLVSGFLRITLLSCLVLSAALFLPKLFLSAEKEKVLLHSEVGPGRRLAVRYGHAASAGDDRWPPETIYTTSPNSKSRSQRTALKKSTLLAQVSPVYGFGIFLYIIYIFYKLTNKHRPTKQPCMFYIMRPEHSAPETSEDEMLQLQTRLKEMEGERQRRKSQSIQNPARRCKYRNGQEERKLQHLRKITHVLMEGRLLEDVPPEVEAEETPYSADWEGYPEETFPQYEVPLCRRRHPSVILEEPYGEGPTPEELAERMQKEDEEDEKNEEETEEVNDESSEDEDCPKGMKEEDELKQALPGRGEETDDHVDDADDEDYKQDEEEEEEEDDEQPFPAYIISDEEETPSSPGIQKDGETSGRRRQIMFNNHRHVLHYLKGGAAACSYEDEEVEEDVHEDEDNGDDEEEDMEDEEDDLAEKEMQRVEDDPLIEAECLGFSTQFTCDPEEQEVDLIDFLLTYKPEDLIKTDQSGAAEAPGLRMRYKNEKREN